MTSFIQSIETLLLSTDPNRAQYQDIIKTADDSRKKHTKKNASGVANKLWQLQTALEIKDRYIGIFEMLKAQKHMEAWRALEQCEISISSLIENSDLEFIEKYKINFYENHVEYWQELFPYILFLSPGFIVGYYTCTICGHKIRPRSRCEHKKGKIYNGELCVHEAHDMEFLEISLVTNPVQKYSVIEKDYDYSIVNYVIERINHPFEPWKPIKTTKTFPRNMFESVKKEDQCPCRSEVVFGSCCYQKESIEIPHIEVVFAKSLPEHLQTSIFPYNCS